MTSIRFGLGVALLAGAVSACGRPAQVPKEGPPSVSASDKADRESLSVTVYNQNIGVVRERRRLKLGRGLVQLSFKDVSAFVQPQTVRIASTTQGALFEVLEQNYRYDLLTPAKLLEKHVGKQISVYRYNEKTGSEEKKTAEVLSVEGGVTLRIDGEVTTSFNGRYAFAELPPNLLDKPTLVWLLRSDRPEQSVEVTYLTENLNWRADYVLKLDATDTRADLTGWVTLDNNSGASYENANLRLVAGDVNRVTPPPAREEMYDDAIVKIDAGSAQLEREGLLEYHLYSLGRPTTLRDKETKQVSLLSAEGVAVSKKLVLIGQPYVFRGRYGQPQRGQKPSVFIELENAEQNRLGVPLPKGTVRVYKADRSGALQFVGEDAIDHTPRDERVRVKLGQAFDVVAERVQTDWAQLSECSAESEFEIELRNHKDRAEQVEINEPTGADWELTQHSHPYAKVDAGTFRFDVQVPARGTITVSYRVRVRYC